MILICVLFVGYLYDVTGSYDIPFVVNGSIEILAGILLMYMPYCEWRQRRKKVTLSES